MLNKFKRLVILSICFTCALSGTISAAKKSPAIKDIILEPQKLVNILEDYDKLIKDADASPELKKELEAFNKLSSEISLQRKRLYNNLSKEAKELLWKDKQCKRDMFDFLESRRLQQHDVNSWKGASEKVNPEDIDNKTGYGPSGSLSPEADQGLVQDNASGTGNEPLPLNSKIPLGHENNGVPSSNENLNHPKTHLQQLKSMIDEYSHLLNDLSEETKEEIKLYKRALASINGTSKDIYFKLSPKAQKYLKDQRAYEKKLKTASGIER